MQGSTMKSNPASQPRKSSFQIMKSNPGFTLFALQKRVSMFNPALSILGEHTKKGLLEFCSSEPCQPMEPYLSSKNYAEIFFYPIRTWFVHKAAVKVSPVTNNGCVIFAFNPSTGQLLLKTNIHASNTNQEVATLLRSVPDAEHPKRIFVNVSKGMLGHSPMGFPNMVMKGSELKLPFQAYLKIEKFIDLIKLKANSTYRPHEVNFFSFNIYDDWLKSNVTYTAFNRISF